MSDVASAWCALFVVAVGVVGGYLISLRLHPDRDCWACKGSGRHYGAIFKSGRRRCQVCIDTPGRRPRWGTWLLRKTGWGAWIKKGHS